MSVVRKFEPEVRLKKLLSDPGGMTAEQALKRAKDGMDSIRGACLEATDAKIAEMQTLTDEGAPGRTDKIYRLANEVFAESGAYGLGELSIAAHSLCSLLAAHESSEAPKAAVMVHLEAMRMLRREDGSLDKAARAALLQGLRSVVAKYA